MLKKHFDDVEVGFSCLMMLVPSESSYFLGDTSNCIQNQIGSQKFAIAFLFSLSDTAIGERAFEKL